MKVKRILASVCALAIVGTAGLTAAYAANAEDTTTNTRAAWFENRADFFTDEQRAAMEAVWGDMEFPWASHIENWGSLTAEERQELFATFRSEFNTEEGRAAAMERFAEFGWSVDGFPFGMMNLTDEQRAAMEAMWSDMEFPWASHMENWSNLTAEERQELFDTFRSEFNTEEGRAAAMERFAEFGWSVDGFPFGMMNLTDEQRAVMENWGNLTAEQRQEMFSNRSQFNPENRAEAMEAFLESGLISEEMAQAMQEWFTEGNWSEHRGTWGERGNRTNGFRGWFGQ